MMIMMSPPLRARAVARGGWWARRVD